MTPGLTLRSDSSVVLVLLEPVSETVSLGVLPSGPFIFGLIYGAYWLEQTGLESARYGRIAESWGAGAPATAIINFMINPTIRPMNLQTVVETVRWSAASAGVLDCSYERSKCTRSTRSFDRFED